MGQDLFFGSHLNFPLQWKRGGDPCSWPPSAPSASACALRLPLDGGGEGAAQGGAPRQEGQGGGGRPCHPLSKAPSSGDLVVRRAEQPILV